MDRSRKIEPKITSTSATTSPEEVVLVAETITLLLGHVVAWTARRVAPAVNYLASDDFAGQLHRAGDAIGRHAEARARHRRQIAVEHRWEP